MLSLRLTDSPVFRPEAKAEKTISCELEGSVLLCSPVGWRTASGHSWRSLRDVKLCCHSVRRASVRRASGQRRYCAAVSKAKLARQVAAKVLCTLQTPGAISPFKRPSLQACKQIKLLLLVLLGPSAERIPCFKEALFEAPITTRDQVLR